MFEANPQLVDLIVDISATAPRLSRYLSRHSAVLDAVLDGRFFAPWPGRGRVVADLRGRLDGEDYEQALDAARRWQHEWHFRIGVHQLRGLITPETAGRHYAEPRRRGGDRALAAGLYVRSPNAMGPRPGAAAR
jgi:glutamate-ammonia-ligase adenylyltransferase